VFINNGHGVFETKALPMEAQVSPVYGIAVDDVNGDGNADLLLGGNLYRVKPEAGRYDASYGCVMVGDGHGNFTNAPPSSSGFKVDGEIRDILLLRRKAGDIFLVSRNNAGALTFGRASQQKK
jgi:hypothetical protein